MQITLVYDCEIGIQNPAAMAAKVGAINLYNNGTLDFLPLTVASDVTIAAGNIVTRTIIFDVTAQGLIDFPTDEEKKAMTRQLFTQQLALSGLVSVTAAEPVVTP